MAELKTQGRQIGQPAAPDISGAAAPAQAINSVVQQAASTVGEYVARERKAGLELEANFNTLSGKRELGLQLAQAKGNPNSTEQSYADFNKTQADIVSKILENTSKENRTEVSKSLMSAAVQNEISMSKHVIASKKRNILDNDAALFYESVKQIEEDATSGNIQGATDTYNQSDKSRLALTQARYLSQEEYLKGRDLLAQAAINGTVANEYSKVWEAGGERAAAQFVNDFWNKTPTNMTELQKNKAMQSLLSLASRDRAASSQVSYMGQRDVISSIYNNPPKNETELSARIKQSGEQGFPLNERQAYGAFQKYRKLHAKEMKRENMNGVVAKQIADGDINGLIFNNSKDNDNYYVDTVKALIERQVKESENPQTDAQRIMSNQPGWMIGATIAAEVPVPLRQWQDEIHSQLRSSVNEDVINAVKAYHYVAEKNPQGIDGIPEKDQSYMRAIINDMENTTRTPEESITLYKEQILNVDPTVEKNRDEAYKTIIKNNPSIPNKIVKQAFGAKIKNTLTEPNATLYATAQDQFEKEYKRTGNEKQSIANAVSYLDKNAGESMFAKKGEPVWNPQENLPFYDFGNIVRNQSTKYLSEVVRNAAKNPGKLPYTVEWSDKMDKFPDKLSEEDLFKKKYDKGEWWLKIDKKDRQVFFVSPNYNQANAYSRTQYQVMFERDGYQQNLMTVTPKMGRNGEITSSVGNAMMTYLSPTELTPNLIKHMESQAADTSLTNGATDLFNEDNYTAYGINAGARVHPEKRNKKEFIEKAKQELPKKIEEEKLRRQQSLTNQLINETNSS